MDMQRFSCFIRDRLDQMRQSPITVARQAGLPRDAIRSVFRGHPPSLERAAAIASALGYELVLRPRGAAAPEDQNPAKSPEFRRVSNEYADPRLAELLEAIAAEHAALNDAGQASLLTRIWGLHPELRERAADRAGPLRSGGRRKERPPHQYREAAPRTPDRVCEDGARRGR